MANFSGNYFSIVQFMIASDGGECAAGNSIRSLQDHRTRAALPQKFFYMRWHAMQIVLRPARRPAFNFGLLNVHNERMIATFPVSLQARRMMNLGGTVSGLGAQAANPLPFTSNNSIARRETGCRALRFRRAIFRPRA